MNTESAPTEYGFVLSDPVTQKQFSQTNVAFNVKEIRDYKNALAYISDEHKQLYYMVVLNSKNHTFQPRVYYLDAGGTLSGFPAFATLLNACGEDLADNIEATLQDDLKKSAHLVHWQKKGQSLSLKNNRIIAEYITKDKKMKHNHCLIDWKGDNKTGRIEVWYGQKIKKKEVRIFRFPVASEDIR